MMSDVRQFMRQVQQCKSEQVIQKIRRMSMQQLFGLRRDVERDFKQRSEHFKMSAFGSNPPKPATVEDAITADSG